jgi:murein DD-endopeptidase MepM/ murein hydrolase activator NlpD
VPPLLADLMALYPPVLAAEGGYVTQKFGPTNVAHEPAMYHDSANHVANYQRDYALPVYSSQFHPALDIAAAQGTRIRASEAGTVTFAGKDIYSGNSLKVEVKISGTRTYYCSNHCYSIGVKVGDKVARGQIIAHVGQTGWASGPHDHFWVGIYVLVSGVWRFHFYDPGLFLPTGTYKRTTSPSYAGASGALANDPRIKPV